MGQVGNLIRHVGDVMGQVGNHLGQIGDPIGQDLTLIGHAFKIYVQYRLNLVLWGPQPVPRGSQPVP